MQFDVQPRPYSLRVLCFSNVGPHSPNKFCYNFCTIENFSCIFDVEIGVSNPVRSSHRIHLRGWRKYAVLSRNRNGREVNCTPPQRASSLNSEQENPLSDFPDKNPRVIKIKTFISTEVVSKGQRQLNPHKCHM